MTDIQEQAVVATTIHPLDPLMGDEIAMAARILRAEKQLGPRTRFISINLHEPPKAQVLALQPGETLPREAFVILLDKAEGQTYEAVVSLTEGRVTTWRHMPGVQPPIIGEEVAESEQVLKAHPDFQAALARRGITDLALVMVDSWTIGNYGDPEENGRRILRSLCYLKNEPNDNGYGRPIEGIIAYIDLNSMQIIRVEDHGVQAIPSEQSNYQPEDIGGLRADLKPIDISQPEGPSFTVNGHEVRWQKWRFRVGFNTREGLVLHTLSYDDAGRERSILYRASVAEMVVPYGDPGLTHYRKCAFDVGEYGIGMVANALRLGCDCLGYIHYFDAHVNDADGNPVTIDNAICMHEEDFSLLWKHFDWRIDRTDVRRSRRLVISFICTIDNYDYGFYWNLYQDGTIELEVKLTGILSAGAIADGQKSPYGTLVAPNTYTPIHQHIFCTRLDMMVDGPNNTVHEVHTEAVPPGPENPWGNACVAKATPLRTEQEAQQTLDLASARYWKIVNPNQLNRMGEPVGYKIVAGENALPFLQPEASVMRRAGFINKHLWVTAYNSDERYPAGDYPNQRAGGDGLPEWTQANRNIDNTDVVVWYVMNHHHVPRLEDWPVMPVSRIGFMLKPVNFFDRSPALDAPESPPRHGTGHGCTCDGENCTCG